MLTLEISWSYRPFRALVLENRTLRVVVLPELGGRIWSIVYKPHGRELLWHNPRIPPQSVPFGTAFDNVWCGGWEELFPSPAPAEINGEPYPDHGEVWCLPWRAETEREPDSVSVRLSCEARISAVRLQKRITLRGDEPRVEIAYSLHNPGLADFPFILTLHPAFSVVPGCRIDFPPMEVELDSSYAGTLAGVASPFTWPHATRASKQIDLRIVAPHEAGEVYFFYGTGLREGWCAVTDTVRRLTWGLVFPPQFFPACWVFASYGGWRNHDLVVLEPSTSYPQQFDRAVRNRTAESLPAGGTLETSVGFQVQEGLSEVAGLTADAEFRA